MASTSKRIIPGFSLSMGYTLTYLTLIVLIPLAALVLKSMELTWAEFWTAATDPTVVSSYKVTFGASVAAAIVNGFFGLIVAWVLVRYPLPGKRFLDALIDFPFALPTAVAGLTFSNLYTRDGWIGGIGQTWAWWPISKIWNGLAFLVNQVFSMIGAAPLGPASADFLALSSRSQETNLGIVVVLIFVGLPFVVRTVQPVLMEFEAEYEQAAASLGASRWTIFRRVIFPTIYPAWLSGLALSFARAVGEYGSVIFIASNLPGKSQIAPQQIIQKLDDFKYAQATAISVVLLVTSLLVLLLINGLEWWSRRHERVKA